MTKHSIQIDFSENIEINHPKCIHGPTLLFHSSTLKFFACSACRDRQECDLYIPYEKRTQRKSKKIIERHEKEYKKFRKYIRILQRNRKILNKQSNL